MINISENIALAQNGDKTAFLRLIGCFSPLLKKYAFLLKYEDAYFDLQIKLIEIIMQLKLSSFQSTENPVLIGYFKNSLHHRYIALSQKQQILNSVLPMSALCLENEDDTYILDKLFYSADTYPAIEYDFLCQTLTPRQAQIILLFFFYRYPVKDIARMLHITPSAVSQAKAFAIQTLKQYITASDPKKRKGFES